MIRRIQSFLSNNIQLVVVVIVALGGFLRLYRVSDYMNFLGDEGRDVLTVKHILEGQLTLLGPRSSAADFYYGPIYYYMITPFLWLFNYDPVGPAVFIGILGTITVYLVYRFGKNFFGRPAGLIAAALFAVSPVVLTYSRSSWNPNPLPFVSLVTLYLLYRAVSVPKRWKFLLLGLLLGVAIQLQYIALFLFVIVGVYLTLATVIEEKKRVVISLFERYALIAVGFLVGWSPFLAFEAHHGFPNLKTILGFILGKYSTVLPTHTTPFGQVSDAFFKLFGRLVTRFPFAEMFHIHDSQWIYLWYILSILFGVICVIGVFFIKNKLVKLLFLCWIVIGVGLFAFYKKEIYDYYLGFMFPLPFLLIGNLLSLGLERTKRKILPVIAVLVFVFLFAINIVGLPFRYQPNRLKDQVKTISEFVISKTDNKPYNFALITPGNSDHGYRYYMEILNHTPIVIENSYNDPERKTVTDQLLVVCEDVSCHPLGDSLFEVAAFGRAEIVQEWDVSVVKVFKLRHYTGQDN